MSKTWVISDIYFGHANIIKYCNNPFEHSFEMDDIHLKIRQRKVKQIIDKEE